MSNIKNTIGRILKRGRWDDQGGYPSYEGNGKWSFISRGITMTPEELNELFKFAKITPDVIKPLGDCTNCESSSNGLERGYVDPCLTCKRPRMSNFVRKELGK